MHATVELARYCCAICTLSLMQARDTFGVLQVAALVVLHVYSCRVKLTASHDS